MVKCQPVQAGSISNSGGQLVEIQGSPDVEVHLWKNDFTGRSSSLGQLADFDHLRLCEGSTFVSN